MSRLILASASPRRQELLAALGIPFDLVPSQADETLREGIGLPQALEEVALRKARAVAKGQGSDAWVLGADTEVALGNQILGKPRDPEDARAMLRALSGRTHRVLTAVALVGGDVEHRLSVATEVRFRALTAGEIAWYADLAEPYDKAGGYAIQGRGAFLVADLKGSYTNVVGLPVAETAALLAEVGFCPWAGHG